MRKQVLTVFMAGILTASMSMTALAGWEQEGNNWKYNDNGAYAANGWEWIDGNGDGVAECYYFDNNGILARDTMVDNNTVNADGAWIVEGVVQTQSIAADNGNAGAVNTGNYDPQYPLAGMLDQLGLNFARTPNGIDMLYWSQDYQSDTNGFDVAPINRWQKAKETNNLGYYYGLGQNWDEMLAIAKLAGRTDINLPYADEARAESLANNIRDFFKAFPNWKTASDYEKACHIARWIEQADYVTNSGNDGTSYACLINKACVCEGYWQAGALLAHCVGIEVMPGVTSAANHVFPVFNINGVMLGYDAASQGKETSFWIYDVYEHANYSRYSSTDFDLDFIGNTYKYFKDRGYVVPTSLKDKFDSSLLHAGVAKGVPQDVLILQ